MEHLKIQHVGAIHDVGIDLKKINVIIGPQSSGKSTICKIACYCSWVEKHVCLNQSFDFFENGKTFYEELVRFHKLKGYFHTDSYIEYENDTVKFSYSHKTGKPVFEWKERYEYRRAKIAYIPSERNLVSVIPNWFEVKFDDNNIRSFMSDWADARTNYTRENPLPVLKLGVNYYFDEASGRSIVVDGAVTLDLTNTSSGLQSVIPLEMMVDYLTTCIYKNKATKRSVIDEERDHKLAERLYEDLFNLDKLHFPAEGGPHFFYIAPSNVLHIFRSQGEFDRYSSMKSRMLEVQHTKLYVEEPEQNIFPETQRDLLYYFIETVKTRDAHALFITTHSPYILSALNNCLVGYMVQEKMPKEEREALKSNRAWIDPASVAAHEITPEGTLKPVQNKETGTIGKHYFNRINNEIMDEYYDMLNYLEADDKG
jgi:AAA15 family ATPase/GTPase